jgi:enoyl-CoA hydratase/carnithine racemase
MADGGELLVELDGRVALLTLNRPERRNALSSTMLVSLAETLRRLEEEGQARCVILRGAGEKAFSAGMDLSALPEGIPSDVQSLIEEKGPLAYGLDAVEECSLPVIAMIRGWCLGAGCETAMACDLRVGAQGCRMGMPPARLGIVYPPEGLQRFIRAVGPSVTRKIFLTARYFEGEEALASGMLHYLISEEQLEEFTLELAREVAALAPLSLAGHKRSLYHLTRPLPLSQETRAEVEGLMARALASEDAREGLAAFAQKRAPEFKGR